MNDDLICKKHNKKMECMGGESAHRDNWYCQACENEENARAEIEESLGVDLESYIETVQEALIEKMEEATVGWHLDFVMCVSELQEIWPVEEKGHDELQYRRYEKKMDEIKGKYGDETYQLAKHAVACENIMQSGIVELEEE